MSKRICVFPALDSPYDRKMCEDFAAGLCFNGHEVFAAKRPINDEKLGDFVTENNLHTVIRINKFPPSERKKYQRYRHISWFQDVFPSTGQIQVDFLDGDSIVTLGSAENLGLNIGREYYQGSFSLYINPDDFKNIKIPLLKKYDANIIGFIPRLPTELAQNESRFLNGMSPNGKRALIFKKVALMRLSQLLAYHSGELVRSLKTLRFEKFNQATLQRILMHYREAFSAFYVSEPSSSLSVGANLISKQYEALAGNLDCGALEEHLDNEFKNLGRELEHGLRDYLVRELPRYIDRYELASRMLKLSANVSICGNNWSFLNLCDGYDTRSVSFKQSLDIFANSKITLQNNNHGIGLHSRTLSAMASGGFVLSHTSPRDEDPGGLLTVFDVDKHLGLFDRQNFEEVVLRWLRNDTDRNKVVAAARNLVLEQFNWNVGASHFAKQVNL